MVSLFKRSHPFRNSSTLHLFTRRALPAQARAIIGALK
jgi:hypothetical protein